MQIPLSCVAHTPLKCGFNIYRCTLEIHFSLFMLERGCLNVCIKGSIKATQEQTRIYFKKTPSVIKSVFKLPNSKHEHWRDNEQVYESDSPFCLPRSVPDTWKQKSSQAQEQG